jgi:hypothetical protein
MESQCLMGNATLRTTGTRPFLHNYTIHHIRNSTTTDPLPPAAAVRWPEPLSPYTPLQITNLRPPLPRRDVPKYVSQERRSGRSSRGPATSG